MATTSGPHFPKLSNKNRVELKLRERSLTKLIIAAPSYFHRFSEGINPPLQLDKTRPRDLGRGAMPHRRRERAVLWPVQEAQEVDAPAKASGATWAAMSPRTKEIQLLNYTKCRTKNNILSPHTQQPISSRTTGHPVPLSLPLETHGTSQTLLTTGMATTHLHNPPQMSRT